MDVTAVVAVIAADVVVDAADVVVVCVFVVVVYCSSSKVRVPTPSNLVPSLWLPSLVKNKHE